MRANSGGITILPERDKKIFREYLVEKESAKATVSKYMTDVSTFIRYLDGDYRLDKKRLLSYKEWLENNYAPASINSMIVALNQFLQLMGGVRLKLKCIKLQKRMFMPEEKEMSRREYERLLETAKKYGNMQLVLSMETMASTGARVSELKYFTVEQVSRGTVDINNKGKLRQIILPRPLKMRLLRLASEQKTEKGAIFVTKTGKARDRISFWREMKALHKEARVDSGKVFPHNLRHLFASTYYKATKDLSGLANLLGHSSLDVTRIYTAVSRMSYLKKIEQLQLVDNW